MFPKCKTRRFELAGSAGGRATTLAECSQNTIIVWVRLYLERTNLRLIKSVFHLKRERRNMRTIFLLTISNIFMTFAWYGHLKYRTSALWKVILVSWGIAFFEYCFQVPANRFGSYEFSTAQLKTIQEVITLSVFSVFSVLYLGEKIKWNHAAGFGCIAMAVFFVFHKW
jgi:uncharacterized protein